MSWGTITLPACFGYRSYEHYIGDCPHQREPVVCQCCREEADKLIATPEGEWCDHCVMEEDNAINTLEDICEALFGKALVRA